MPIRDLSEIELKIAYGLSLRLQKLQGITSFSAICQELIHSKQLSRGQFNALKEGVKTPYRSVAPRRVGIYGKSRKRVTLATKA